MHVYTHRHTKLKKKKTLVQLSLLALPQFKFLRNKKKLNYRENKHLKTFITVD